MSKICKLVLSDGKIVTEKFLDGDAESYSYGDKVLGFVFNVDKDHQIRSMYNKKYIKEIHYDNQ